MISRALLGAPARMRGFDPNEFTLSRLRTREGRVEFWIQNKPDAYVIVKVRVPALLDTDIIWLACDNRQHMFSMLEWQVSRLGEDGWKKA